jgi:UPF0755 protein
MADPQNKLQDNFFFNNYGKKQFEWPTKRLCYLAAVIVVFAICYWLLISAPVGFPSGKIIPIPVGASLLKASEILEQSSAIRSPLLFRLAVRFLGGSKGVKAGDYLFEKPQNVVTIAKRLTEGERGFAPVVVLIPEGTSVRQIADILASKLPDFDKKEFLKIAQGREGYLFPDTYNFAFDAAPKAVLDAFLSNFDKRIEMLQNEIKSFGRPLADVISMASIVEEEGRITETRRTIAGILWKRLDIGMPLQTDSAFQYVNGKTTFELATSDLAIDSPYNTYLYKGLPPTPITNPGLDAILAAITPLKTPYLYYLTDKDGKMHYAVTYEEHLLNKEKFLRQK